MKLLGITCIAAILDMTEAHVRDRITKRRDFPRAFRPNGCELRWAESEVEAWLESRRLSPAARKPKTQRPQEAA